MADVRRRLPIFEQGVLPYLWLVYVLAIPLVLIVAHAPARITVLQLAVMAVFFACYFLGYGTSGRRALAFAAVFVLLWRDRVAERPGRDDVLHLRRQLHRWGTSARDAYRILALYVPLAGVLMWLTHVELGGAIAGLVFSVIVGVACVNAAQQKRDHSRLKQAYEQIEGLAKIAERERIARDLHDVLGHTLSLIALKSQLASKLADRDPQRAVAEIRDVEQIARTSLDELREAVAGYRGAGIPEELAHARDVLTSAGLRVECEAEDVRLPARRERAGTRKKACWR